MSLAVKLPTGEEIGSLPFGRCCLFAVPLTNNRTFVYEVCMLDDTCLFLQDSFIF